MFKYILFLYVVTPSVICQWKYDHIEDRTSVGDKERVKELVRVLLVESKYKINQMDYIRNMFANTAGFQVGTIIGTIREKYKTMLIVYKQKENRYLKKATIQGARTPVRRPLHYFLRMELLNRLEFEIDRLVHVLETTVPKATFKLPNFRRANRRTDYNMEDIKKYRDDFFKKLNITTKFKDEEDYMI